MNLQANTYQASLDAADLIYDAKQLDIGLNNLARQLNIDFAKKNPLVITVMNGALMTAGHLLPKLTFALEVDYLHATRYDNNCATESIRWLSYPQQPLKKRHVLLIDDIFDVGTTLKTAADYCAKQGAYTVRTAVLLDKQHQRKVKDFSVDYVGLPVEDRYVFGFGLDYNGLYRNAPGIYAVAHSDD